jgi:hypothetical protein
MLTKIYCWLKENDIPNWISLLFTVIFWPLVLYLWSRRKLSSIPSLTVSMGRGEISIPNNPNIPALTLTFINSSNSTMFITNPRLRNNRANLEIHPDSSRDFRSGYYELKFHDGNNAFNVDEEILRTNERTFTAIGLIQIPNVNFFNYKSNFFRNIFNYPKYFILQYTALVGNKRYLIKTIF